MEMKKTAGVVTLFSMLLLVAMSSTLRAETLTGAVLLSPANEVPAITTLNASGMSIVTINVTRDGTGAITAATIRLSANFNFPTGVTINGFHIHEQAIGKNGSVRFNSGLSGTNSLTFPNGAGRFEFNLTGPDLTILGRLLAKPSAFYVNIHTSDFPGGAIRGQILRLVESVSTIVPLTTAQEVPSNTANASGMATVTFNPTRASNGAVNGGSFTFTASVSLPPGDNVTGFHVHEGAAGANGPVLFNTGVGGANPVVVSNGQATFSFTRPLTSQAQVDALTRLFQNPAGFYANVHTVAFPGGIIRGQLVSMGNPPVIMRSDTPLLTTATFGAIAKFTAAGLEDGGFILVNGQPVTAFSNISTGELSVMIPGPLRATAGTLLVQAQDFANQRSAPFAIVVAAPEAVNDIQVTSVDAAGYNTTQAPEAIVAAFGNRLATGTSSATTTPLPSTLSGTSVYVNGLPASLFMVSPQQVNLLVPTGALAGPGDIVIVAGDGSVTSGSLNMGGVSPGLFTILGNGAGAPSGYATKDGTTFTQLGDMASGVAAPIDAGSFVSLFGTGCRFASGASADMTVSIGGMNITPLFIGKQPGFDGLDQINIQVPMALAGKGEVTLNITVDGVVSNTVTLNIK
jgi:uncharacterized protein (TIGR03437 family)